MRKMTAVLLAVLMLNLSGCGGSPAKSSALPEVSDSADAGTSVAVSTSSDTISKATTSGANASSALNNGSSSPAGGKSSSLANNLTVFKNGQTDYILVRGTEAEEKKAARLILQNAYEKNGTQMEVQEGVSSLSKTYEILIGETGRPETETARKWMGGDSIIVTVINEKIVILGSTPANTLLGAETFVKEYLQGPNMSIARSTKAIYGLKSELAYGEYVNGTINANDPWVVRDGDHYYYCWSDQGGVCVAYCETLADVATAFNRAHVVWRPEQGTAYSQELWAPELHYIDGAWYIYVAADDGNNANHRMYVLKSTSGDPTKSFEFVGKISDSTDKWAIDGTVFSYNNELYFVWSGWEGNTNIRQNIYIAHMSNPWTIDGPRVELSRPEYSWEKVSSPDVNEGPVALVGKDTICLVYSASGCWTDDYCLGMLTWRGGSLLDSDNWKKSASPVFSKSSGAYGPGHCSFTQALDGQWWMFYHANAVAGTGLAGRNLRMQPIKWDGKTLELGTPAALGGTVRYPYKVNDTVVRLR